MDTSYTALPAKLHNSVGPRRLARSLLLSLSRKTLKSSDITSEPGSSDSNTPSTEEKTSGDPTQAREPVGCSVGSSGEPENDAITSKTSSDAGSAGTDDFKVDPSSSKSELQAAQLTFRRGRSVTNEETGPSQQPHSYKYLLVDDNDINLKILASFMKRLGHGYDTAANGLEALQMYTSNPGLYPFVLMGKSSMASMQSGALVNHMPCCRHLHAFNGRAGEHTEDTTT